jgi:hypothetical protein
MELAILITLTVAVYKATDKVANPNKYRKDV